MHIVLITGIYLDKKEEEYDLNKQNIISNTVNIYDNIPIYFYDKQSWLATTNRPCFHCNCIMDKGIPYFDSKGLEYDEDGIKRHHVGLLFCHRVCYYTWLKKTYKTEDELREKLLLLNDIDKHLSPDISNIRKQKIGPDITKLTKYGGNTTEEEYWMLLNE